MLEAPRKSEQEARQLWATPQAFVRGVEALSGVPIVLDTCAEAHTTKAKAWFGPASFLSEDGLGVSWEARASIEVATESAPLVSGWCNPPFGAIDPWVERALAESGDGYLTWLLVPPRTERPWWSALTDREAHLTTLEIPRLQFEPPPGIKASSAKGAVVLWQVGGPRRLLPRVLRTRDVLRAGGAS